MVNAGGTPHVHTTGGDPCQTAVNKEGSYFGPSGLVRRLTAHELDETHHVSILLAGTDRLLDTQRDPNLAPLRTRFAYVHALRNFGIEDARNYVQFHLKGAGARSALFTDGAITHLFHASQGIPRAINQLALQAMVDAVVSGLDDIDANLMKRVLHAHPLYAAPSG